MTNNADEEARNSKEDGDYLARGGCMKYRSMVYWESERVVCSKHIIKEGDPLPFVRHTSSHLLHLPLVFRWLRVMSVILTESAKVTRGTGQRWWRKAESYLDGR
jgi:hypothetical protein